MAHSKWSAGFGKSSDTVQTSTLLAVAVVAGPVRFPLGNFTQICLFVGKVFGFEFGLLQEEKVDLHVRQPLLKFLCAAGGLFFSFQFSGGDVFFGNVFFGEGERALDLFVRLFPPRYVPGNEVAGGAGGGGGGGAGHVLI